MSIAVTKGARVGRADISRLMAYHDRQFVEVSYRLLLGRPADPEGLKHHLSELRRGTSRREIAYRLATSAEGQAYGVDQRLFRPYLLWRKAERIPVLGTVCLLLLCLMRFKSLVREFRRIQNAVFGHEPSHT